MLEHLRVKDFALIRELEIRLQPGLNIITGETGAGKSILIDAVSMILGGRASQDLIRSGTKKAVIEARFRISGNAPVKQCLIKNGYDVSGNGEEETILVSREINRSGKNICRINGELSNISLLKKTGQFLVDIHGQNEHQSILKPEKHIDLLDSFIGFEIQEILPVYQSKLKNYNRVIEKVKSFDRIVSEKEQKTELLQFQADEIDVADLTIEEEEKLHEEREILGSAEKLFQLTNQAYECLYENTGAFSAVDLMGQASSFLEEAARIDSKLEGPKEICEDAVGILEDSSRQIRQYRDEIEFSPDRLNEIDARLEMINQLKRKYGGTIEDILLYKEKAEKEIEELMDSERILSELEKEKQNLVKELRITSQKMSELRKEGASNLRKQVCQELEDLNMENTRFEVDIEAAEDLNNTSSSAEKVQSFNKKGVDTVEFLLSPNKGEPLKPLVNIASGGEVSRIMLAIKTVLAFSDQIPTLIFDEIDAGIGGKAAQSVGSKMQTISSAYQVLCVTHLPQIAALANNHYMISKKEVTERTETFVHRLSEKERIQEIARMLYGDKVSETTLKHAEEMINSSKYRS